MVQIPKQNPGCSCKVLFHPVDNGHVACPPSPEKISASASVCDNECFSRWPKKFCFEKIKCQCAVFNLHFILNTNCILNSWSSLEVIIFFKYSDPSLYHALPIAASLFCRIFYSAFFTVNSNWLRGVTVV